MITVNAISRSSGVSVHTVRDYSRSGLLKPQRDPENGYRIFQYSDLCRLNFIRRAQNLGFTLNGISEILGIPGERESRCHKVMEIAQRRIDENRAKIERLIKLQRRMEKAITVWQTLSDRGGRAYSGSRLIDSASEALSSLVNRPAGETRYV